MALICARRFGNMAEDGSLHQYAVCTCLLSPSEVLNVTITCLSCLEGLVQSTCCPVPAQLQGSKGSAPWTAERMPWPAASQAQCHCIVCGATVQAITGVLFPMNSPHPKNDQHQALQQAFVQSGCIPVVLDAVAIVMQNCHTGVQAAANAQHTGDIELATILEYPTRVNKG